MKVLIVDDEPEICELFEMELQDQGWETAIAHNGKKAIEFLENEHFDFVVSDVRMPGGDGVELLEKVHEKGQKRPQVILVTGYADLTEEQAIQKGALAVFPKPINFKAVIAKIKSSS